MTALTVAEVCRIEPGTDQFVYVIVCVAIPAFKIGLAWDPQRRLQQLQVGSPLELELLRYSRGDKALELRLHRALEPWRIRGEWFDLTRESADVAERLLPCTEAVG